MHEIPLFLIVAFRLVVYAALLSYCAGFYAVAIVTTVHLIHGGI